MPLTIVQINAASYTNVGTGPATVLASGYSFYFHHGVSAPTDDANALKSEAARHDTGFTVPGTDTLWAKIADASSPSVPSRPIKVST